MEKKDPDLDLITGNYTQTFKTHVDNVNKTVTHKFVIKKGDIEKSFDPIQYLDLILNWYYYESDKIKNNRKKLVCIANAESKITRLINEFGLDKFGYDFSRIYKDIAVTEKRINSYISGNEKTIAFWSGVGSSILMLLISTGIDYIKDQQKESQENKIEFPKVYQVRDSVVLIYDTIKKK